MRESLKRVGLLSVVALLGIISACGSGLQTKRNIQPHSLSQQDTLNSSSLQIQGMSNSSNQGMSILSATVDNVILITMIDNTKYVSAKELAQALNFQTNWSESDRKLQLGDNDANYELNLDSARVSKNGDDLQLNRPIIMQGDIAYIPVSALGDLFQEEMAYDVTDKELRIHPSSVITIEHEDASNAKLISTEMDFNEDPADPFKGPDEATGTASSAQDAAVWAMDSDNAVPVLKNIDMNALIRKGKQYLGVKYLFGTSPYPKSGRFDCSTYTAYIFAKQGISLPRLARQQGTKGTSVNRKSLRKGDLMFFYVPGRFRTNRTVGHVGIYMGNLQMLHSSPKPENGVQITNINKAYWKETFLFAKRVAY
jgi:cell wall-associated NlpC family hydrolase